MDQIIIAGIAGFIGYFIYHAFLPIKNKIDKQKPLMNLSSPERIPQ